MKKIVMIVFVCALLIAPRLQTEAVADDQYACVKKNNGQFRLVDDPEDCRPSEFSVLFDVKDDDELNGEMCWENSSGECTMRLQFSGHGSLYSFTGKEVCTNDTTTEKHLYGSGSTNSDQTQLNIGLTFTGIMGTSISHDGAVFVMDLDEGFGLRQLRESNDSEECDGDPPCIVEDEYTPVDCVDDNGE
jgi:hypothetical protein